MNAVSSRRSSKTETQITESDDGHGNIVQTETTVTQTYLYIRVCQVICVSFLFYFVF